MTLYHFVNCTLLTFLPCFAVYSGKRLNEIGGLKPLLYGTVGYLLSQLIKLVLIATIYSSYIEGEFFSLTHVCYRLFHKDLILFGLVRAHPNRKQEVSNMLFNIINLIGMYFALSYCSGSNDARIWGVGIGWTIGHHIAAYGPSLWTNARALEFDFVNLQNAIAANTYLLIFIALSHGLYLFNHLKRRDIPPLTYAVLFISLSIESIVKFLSYDIALDPWVVLAFRISLSLSSVLMAKFAYMSVHDQNTQKKK